MNAMQMTRRTAQWMAGTIALPAAVLTLGGALRPAEHDAQLGAGREPCGYDAAGRAARAAREIAAAAWPTRPGSRSNAGSNVKT